MAFTPDPVLIPYVSQAEIANAADVPDLSEDMALRLHALISTLQTSVTAAQQALVPVGLIAPFGGSVAPTGWALCNGQPHNSAALAALLPSGANTPNMINRFVVAAIDGTDSTGQANIYTRGNPGQPGSMAGRVTLTAAQTPLRDHGHSVWLDAANTDHVHGLDTAAAGAGGHGNQLGPYNGVNQDWGASWVTAGATWTTVYQSWTNMGAHGAHDHDGNTNWQSQNPDYWGGPRYQHGHTVNQSNASAAATDTVDTRPPWIALSYIIKKGPGTVNGVYYPS